MNNHKLREKVRHVESELRELIGLFEGELKELDYIINEREENTMNGYPEKDSRDPAYLTAWMREKVKLMIERYNLENSPKSAIITCTFRNPNYQKKLFNKGRLFGKIIFPKKIVTYCDGFKKVSKHNVIGAQAADFAIILNSRCLWDDEEFTPLGIIGKELGLAWGGDWKKFRGGKGDRPHFQQPEGANT